MNTNQKLMLARMGLYRSGMTDTQEMPEILGHQGGFPQQDRMIKDKLRSMQRALKYSYQGAVIHPVDFGTTKLSKKRPFRALMNPNKLKQDYDDKIVSVEFKHGLRPGSVFQWCNTGTYWLIYLHELTELAYFRGDVRKCNYTIDWLDEDGNRQSVYAAVRGPVETKINFIQKAGDSVDRPNLSLNILIPQTEASLAFFKRYAKFYLQERQETCWRIEAVDSFSMPGVIEFSAVEYYINEFKDDDGIANILDMKPIPEDAETSEIIGDIFIKPKTTYIYECHGEDSGSWFIEGNNVPVKIKPNEDGFCEVRWEQTYSGQFVLHCGDYSKTIVVESLF